MHVALYPLIALLSMLFIIVCNMIFGTLTTCHSKHFVEVRLKTKYK